MISPMFGDDVVEIGTTTDDVEVVTGCEAVTGIVAGSRVVAEDSSTAVATAVSVSLTLVIDGLAD